MPAEVPESGLVEDGRVLVHKPSLYLYGSVEPLVDVIVVPGEVHQLISLEFVDRLGFREGVVLP